MTGTSLSAPVALEREVLPRSLLRASLEGQSLVLWRDDSYVLHIWEDRCPHRSVRLSAGRNNGNCIQCPYHGWTFARDGSVAHIPAQASELVPEIKVRTYRCKIIGGLVWTSLGEKVSIPKGFSPSSDDILLRPLPVNVSAVITQATLDRESSMTLIATPSGQNSCVIFGYVKPKDTTIQLLRQCNHRLNVLRRHLEEGNVL